MFLYLILFNCFFFTIFSWYFIDSNASLPEGVSPVDVAALAKYYLASLPEPLTTFELHDEIIAARSSIHVMRNILKRLPTVNYMTLELITALLLHVSQKSPLNKAGYIISLSRVCVVVLCMMCGWKCAMHLRNLICLTEVESVVFICLWK